MSNKVWIRLLIIIIKWIIIRNIQLESRKLGNSGKY